MAIDSVTEDALAKPAKAKSVKEPGPICLAIAQGITDTSNYVRYLATLGGIIFLAWLTINVIQNMDIKVVGDSLVIPITVENLLPVPLLTMVMTGLIAQLGNLTSGPSEAAAALMELIKQGNKE